MKANSLNGKTFLILLLVTSIWINASEVFRYFQFVMPQIKQYFKDQPGIAEMNTPIFLIWGFWDTLLTSVLIYVCWLYFHKFGNSLKNALVAGTLVWVSIFVIFWVATANMGLAKWDILWITLPLSWVEMAIGAIIIHYLLNAFATNPKFAV